MESTGKSSNSVVLIIPGPVRRLWGLVFLVWVLRIRASIRALGVEVWVSGFGARALGEQGA